MNKVTMNVQEGLGKIKLLEKRYEKQLNEGDFVCATKDSDTKIMGTDVKDWQANQKARYDSLIDISNEIEAIKRALNQSNAQTKVKIGGKEYTVAEAIYMKQNGISYKKMLLKKLKENFERINMFIQSRNEQALKAAENFVIQMYGNKEAVSKSETSTDEMNSYYNQHKYDMCDSISILDKIKSLENEIDEFETEVDNVLSVSNATTLIEVEF